MPELTEKQWEKVELTCDTVLEMKAVLLGKNGDLGLVGDFRELKAEQKKQGETIGKHSTDISGLKQHSGNNRKLIIASFSALITLFGGIGAALWKSVVELSKR
jgi:hypothetical protein